MNFIRPENFVLERAPDGTLRAIIDDRCGQNIEIRRALPLSKDDQYFVVRDGKGQELGILETTQGLAPATLTLLQAELASRYFLPQITKIYSIMEKFGSAEWDVETDRGRTQISTKALHEAIIEINTRRFLLRDNEENRFEIRDIEALDENSRGWFHGRGT